MFKREFRILSIMTVAILMLATLLCIATPASAEETVLFSTDYEQKRPRKIMRTEIGHTSIAEELPGGREGHAERMVLDSGRSYVALQPDGIGATLQSYGTLNENDTLNFKASFYIDKEGTFSISPMVLCCINGNVDPEGKTVEEFKAERAKNYKEWYPDINKGTFVINKGSLNIPGQEWVDIDFTYIVKSGCADKNRDVDFYKDAGAFYILFSPSLSQNSDVVYVDDVSMSIDTSIIPSTTTKYVPTTTTTVNEEVSEEESGTVAFDVNDDGVVDMKDVLNLRKYIAGMNVSINQANSDANGDSKIDLKDVLYIRKTLAHLI